MLVLLGHQRIFGNLRGPGDQAPDNFGIRRYRGLGEDADPGALLNQCQGVQVICRAGDDVRFRADAPEPAADRFHAGVPGRNDQGFSGQGPELHSVSGLLCQRMPRRNERDPGLPGHGESFKVLRVIGNRDQGNVHKTAVQLIQDLIPAAVPETEIYQGMFLPEAADPAGCKERCAAFYGADADGA